MDLLSPFYLLLFPCYKWSLSSFNVKVFPSVTSSVTSSSFLSQLHSLFILTNLSSLSSSDCRSKVSWMVTVSKIPMVNYFSCNFIYFLLEFHFQHYHCFFGPLSSRLYSVLCRLSIFTKWHVDLSLGDKEAAQLRTCSAGIYQCRHLSVTDFEYSDVIGYWQWWTSVQLTDLWTEELVVEFILYAITHSYCTM